MERQPWCQVFDHDERTAAHNRIRAALWHRGSVGLTLTESFLGREDLTLSDRLGRELTGILNWALRGLKRLRRRGYFVMPKSSEEAIARLVDQAWCREHLNHPRVVPDHVKRPERYATLHPCHKSWCNNHHSNWHIVSPIDAVILDHSMIEDYPCDARRREVSTCPLVFYF